MSINDKDIDIITDFEVATGKIPRPDETKPSFSFMSLWIRNDKLSRWERRPLK